MASTEFWDIVGKPADPRDLKVGDVATLETTKDGKTIGHRLARVTRCMKSEKGEPQVEFQDVPDGEKVIHSGVVLVVSL